MLRIRSLNVMYLCEHNIQHNKAWIQNKILEGGWLHKANVNTRNWSGVNAHIAHVRFKISGKEGVVEAKPP